MKKDYKFDKKIIIGSIMLSLLVTFFALTQLRSALLDMEYLRIYNRAKTVYNMIDELNRQTHLRKVTRKEAEKEVLKFLSHFTYTDDSSYVWVVDKNYNIIFHPNFEKNINVNDIADEYDKNAFKDLIEDALNSDETSAKVIQHKWKKQKANDKFYIKRSVALKYEPWGWVFGTGTYSDTTEKIFAKFTWYVFATYLIFFIFLIFILNYLKYKSIEKLIETIPFFAVYKNIKSEYVYVNKHVLKVSPYIKNELIGKNYFDKCSQELIDYVIQEDEYVIKTGQLYYTEREVTILDQKCVVQIFKVPIYDFWGKVIGIIIVHRDITEEKRLERVQKEFISVVSHELRTPLTSIIGSIQLVLNLFKDELSEKIKNLLEMTDKNALRLKKLVDNILDTSKLETGRLTFNLQDIDILPLINETIDEFNSYALKYNVNIHFETNIEEVYTHVDSERFKQILLNLLSNAIKFSKKNSNVDVKLEITNSRVKISIINYDAYIPEDKLEKLFKKFSQVDDIDTRSYDGSGLGLYITKQLVDNMYGNINVISDEEKTVFSVEFDLLHCDFLK